MKEKLKKLYSWNTIKLLLAIGLIVFVIQKIDLSYIPELSERMSWLWFFARVAFFFLLLFLKAFQYYTVIDDDISYRDMLTVVVWQNIVSNFISNTAGIASYMTMLKADKKVKLTRSGITFLMVKFGDVLIVGIYLLFSSKIVWEEIQPLQNLTILIIMGIVFGIGLVMTTIIFRESFINLVEKGLILIRIDEFSLVQHGLDTLHSLAQEKQQKIFSMLKKSVLTSALYMTVTMMYSYTVVGIFNLPIKIWENMYITSILQLISFVPIQILGGLGVTEVSMVYLYGVFGIDPVEMAAVSLGVRALFYLLNGMLLFYIPINALMQRKNKDEVSTRAE